MSNPTKTDLVDLARRLDTLAKVVRQQARLAVTEANMDDLHRQLVDLVARAEGIAIDAGVR